MFVYARHLSMIDEWYHERNMDAPPHSSYPEVGFIVPGVAVGFLYQTDSDICMLDGYVSNPKSTEEERDEALDAITTALLDMGRYNGFKECLIISQSKAILARAKKYRFYEQGTFTLMSREGL